MTLLGSSNREMSYFIFKSLEEKGVGFSNAGSIKLEKMLKTVSFFVDDTDMWANGQGCSNVMIMMIRYYSTL